MQQRRADPNMSWAVSCEVREKLIGRMQGIERDGTTIFPDTNPAEAV